MITANVVQIGSSRGIRITKNILEHFGFDKVELEVLKTGLLIKPINNNKISSWDTPELRQKASKEKNLCDDFSAIDTDSWEW